MKSSVHISPFGSLEGHSVELHTMRHFSGIEARVTNFGATLVALHLPDRKGDRADVVLGFDTLEEYVAKNQFFGCTVGRYANRIANARFVLDETEYLLAANNGPHHLHGGVNGFDKKIWAINSGMDGDEPYVRMSMTSPAGEEGYPGTLDVTVEYRLVESGGLQIDYQATTDAPTLVNLTNHSFFNLAGEGAGMDRFLDHELMIHAEQFTPVDDTCIPTGEWADVAGTPLDFRTPQKIGARINDDHPQIRNGRGYDHNFILKEARDKVLTPAAVLCDPQSGRAMAVLTTEPGLQWYSGNYLDGRTGKGGKSYPWRSAGCLEAQTFPDSPNQPLFPSAQLRPGEVYRQCTLHLFSVY